MRNIRTWNYNDKENGVKVDVFGVMNDVFDEALNLNKSDKQLYIFLSSVEKWNAVSLSIREMAKGSGLSNPTVQTSLKNLVASGLISKEGKVITLERGMDFTKNGGYFLIHFSVIQDKEILKEKEAKLVYAYLVRKSMFATQQAEPSLKEIEKACGIKDKKLKNVLIDLEAAGLVHIKKRKTTSGEGFTQNDRNLYTLLEVPVSFYGEEVIEEVVEEEEKEAVIKEDNLENEKEKAFVLANEDKEKNNRIDTIILNENEDKSSNNDKYQKEEKNKLLEDFFNDYDNDDNKGEEFNDFFDGIQKKFETSTEQQPETPKMEQNSDDLKEFFGVM